VILFAKPARRRSRVSEREPDYGAQLLAQLLLAGLPVPEAEVVFHPERKWRFDFCYRAAMLAVEIEGGIYSGGRHTRPKGFAEDIAKYNAATLCGYRLIRLTPEMIASGGACDLIAAALALFGERS
jgi:very-short-patch-repair endonuclease